MKQAEKTYFTFEAEVTPGLEFVTETEILKFGGQQLKRFPGEIQFRFDGNMSKLLLVKSAQSISLVQSFGVPRPRGLLDNTNIRLIFQQIDRVLSLSSSSVYRTFFIAAAGSDSAIMSRIKAAIADHTGLVSDNQKGDLWVRIRPGRAGGWQTVMRLTPRPLVTRPWRVCNLEGALNASTAYAMINLTNPHPEDSFLNLACGSGTLLIERQAYGTCKHVIGIDISSDHLHCAQANVDASGYADVINLEQANLTSLPLPKASVNVLCADLPFGQLTGSHQENRKLYPVMLLEAARVAASDACFVLITHEIRLMESMLQNHPYWSQERVIPINLRGLHPRIYILRRY